MKYCIIRFKAQKNDFEDDVWSIVDYLYCLLNNGQVVDCDNSITISGDTASFCATLPEETALSESNNDERLNELLPKIKQLFDISVEILGNVWNSGKELCNCESSWYILACDLDVAASPVICGNCKKPIPLYKLPYLDEDVRLWKTEYEAIITLWLYSFSDRFTYRQRNNPYSKLSKQGRSVCKAIEKATGKPVYYYLFYSDVASKKPIPKKCPSCGEDWRIIDAKSAIAYKCDNCRLIA